MPAKAGCASSTINESLASIPPWERDKSFTVPKPVRLARVEKQKVAKVPPVKKSRRQRLLERKQRQQDRQTIGAPCYKCGKTEVTREVRTFANGVMHLAVNCAGCGRFIKWQSHEEVAKIDG